MVNYGEKKQNWLILDLQSVNGTGIPSSRSHQELMKCLYKNNRVMYNKMFMAIIR